MTLATIVRLAHPPKASTNIMSRLSIVAMAVVALSAASCLFIGPNSIPMPRPSQRWVQLYDKCAGGLFIGPDQDACEQLRTQYPDVHLPGDIAGVDCNVFKLQRESGRSDSEIASAIGASEADVAKCHGPEHTSNKDSTSAVPAPY
jgi:hypothetical protein